MKTFLPLAFAVVLTACTVDTTGLTKDSNREPKGNTNATVTVVEYGDLQCPSCKSAHALVNATLMEQYGDRIRFEFKHFPLRTLHPFALEAAEASECAADQGKFWEFLDVNYAKQESLSSKALREWASEIGLDTDLFERCMKSNIKRETILADYDAGMNMGVSGTPTYFVNGEKVSSTVEAIGAAIDAAENSVPLPL